MQGTRAERKRDFALCAWGMKTSSDSRRSLLGAKRFRFVIWTVAGVVEIDATRPVIIGRQPAPEGNLLDLTPYRGAHLGVSRHHAIIRPEEEGFTIRDLGSTNGTYLNTMKIDSAHSYPLKSRDELRFGQISMQIMFMR